MKKYILLLIFLLFPTIIKSYENDYFDIEINDKYTLTVNNDKEYKWEKDNEYIIITIISNNDKQNIKSYTDNDIKEYNEYLKSIYTNKIKDNITINTIKTNNKKIYYLESNISIISNDSIGHNIYQIYRTYTTDNYIYNVIYSSNEIIKNTSIIDTITLNDKYPRIINPVLYYILTIIGLLFILLIDYLITKKKHKK